MKKIIYTLLIFLALGHTVYGQQKVITGTVIEDANSTLMPGHQRCHKGNKYWYFYRYRREIFYQCKTWRHFSIFLCRL